MENKTATFTVQGKRFRVKDGTVEVSMYDTTRRLFAVERKAKENGWAVKYTK